MIYTLSLTYSGNKYGCTGRAARRTTIYNPAAGPSSSAHAAERLSIFRPRGRQRSKFSAQRAKKRKLWEHTFCCLASRKQRAPPGPMERGVLMTAAGWIRLPLLRSFNILIHIWCGYPLHTCISGRDCRPGNQGGFTEGNEYGYTRECYSKCGIRFRSPLWEMTTVSCRM